MRFEVAHEFDIPLEALELAVVSPMLVDTVRGRLSSVESVEQTSHRFADGELERVWAYQANVPLPRFARAYVTKEMCAWEEHTRYRLGEHASDWRIFPRRRPEWEKYFHAEGRYRLLPLPEGRSRRVVDGVLSLFVPMGLRQAGERLILSEVEKTLAAEAASLRELATLP